MKPYDEDDINDDDDKDPFDDSGEFIMPYPDGSETLDEALENERNSQNNDDDDD